MKGNKFNRFWDRFIPYVVSAIILGVLAFVGTQIKELIQNDPRQNAMIERIEKKFDDHAVENRKMFEQYWKEYRASQRKIYGRLEALEADTKEIKKKIKLLDAISKKMKTAER